jgi:hypothetical protein
MSVLWIVIIGYAVLSTILVVGLSLWWHVMEAQEHKSFSKLTDAKEKISQALKQYPEKKPGDAIIAGLSELPFPLQKYAENVEERGQIKKFMIEVVTELKNREEPEPSTPSTNSSATS